MTEFETQLLSLLRDIRDELQVATMPEDLRRNQREVIAIKTQQEAYDYLEEQSEKRIDEHLNELLKQHPEKEYEELLGIDEKLQRLDTHSKNIRAKWEANEKRLDTLCKRGCFHPEYIYSI